MSIQLNRELSIYIQKLRFHDITLFGEYKIEIEVVQKKMNHKTGQLEDLTLSYASNKAETCQNYEKEVGKMKENSENKSWCKKFVINQVFQEIDIDEMVSFKCNHQKQVDVNLYALEIHAVFLTKKKNLKRRLKLQDNDPTLEDFYQLKCRKIMLNKINENMRFPIDFQLDDFRHFYLESVVYVNTLCEFISCRVF
jgi:hypothetical protein